MAISTDEKFVGEDGDEWCCELCYRLARNETYWCDDCDDWH